MDVVPVVLRSPAQNPIWLNLVLVLGAAAPIWWVGGKLTVAADSIGSQTRLGQSFAGVVLLAGATSLPDVATTVAAALVGDPQLAVATLIGSIALQTTVLAVADASSARSITNADPGAETLVQFGLLGGLLGLTIMSIAAREPVSLGPVGLGSASLLVGYLVALLIQWHHEPKWRAVDRPQHLTDEGHDRWPVRRAATVLSWGAIVVLVAGTVVARSASAIAEQTGLGSVVVGATLVAAVTSLPEVTTTVSAARRQRERLAFGNILGTNSINVALLFVADLAYLDGAILARVGDEAQLLASLAIVLTCVYLLGALLRPEWTWAHMGPDSLTVIALYLAGVTLLYVAFGSSS